MFKEKWQIKLEEKRRVKKMKHKAPTLKKQAVIEKYISKNEKEGWPEPLIDSKKVKTFVSVDISNDGDESRFGVVMEDRTVVKIVKTFNNEAGLWGRCIEGKLYFLQPKKLGSTEE